MRRGIGLTQPIGQLVCATGQNISGVFDVSDFVTSHYVVHHASRNHVYRRVWWKKVRISHHGPRSAKDTGVAVCSGESALACAPSHRHSLKAAHDIIAERKRLATPQRRSEERRVGK